MIETVRRTRRQERRKTLAALAASLAIHLLLLVLVVGFITLNPAVFFPPPPDDEPVEVTIIPPEPPKPVEKGFIDSAQGEVTEKAPENAAFESDQNTAAASEQAPEADSPLPTQDGDDFGADLRNQDLSIGPIRQPSAPSQPSPPKVAQNQPTKEPQPEQKSESEPEKPKPKPEETPPPRKLEDAELALLDPTPKRTAPRPEPEVRKPERPTPPSPPRPPGFQPQTRTTRLKGGISNRGRSSVDAVATPLGRYKKMLSDAIGSRWYYYVNDMLDLVTIGTVEMRFTVRADGRVDGIRVLSNSSNESLAGCSVRSIIEAEIPPIPDEIAQSLEGGRIEVDYSFTIIGR